MDYSNQGEGQAGGGEATFRYDPTRFWGGWLSLQAGFSRREDHPGEKPYAFAYSRPWALNWVNAYWTPGRYEVSLRGRLAAGTPYTALSMPDGSKIDSPGGTLLYVGPRIPILFLGLSYSW